MLKVKAKPWLLASSKRSDYRTWCLSNLIYAHKVWAFVNRIWVFCESWIFPLTSNSFSFHICLAQRLQYYIYRESTEKYFCLNNYVKILISPYHRACCQFRTTLYRTFQIIILSANNHNKPTYVPLLFKLLFHFTKFLANSSLFSE